MSHINKNKREVSVMHLVHIIYALCAQLRRDIFLLAHFLALGLLQNTARSTSLWFLSALLSTRCVRVCVHCGSRMGGGGGYPTVRAEQWTLEMATLLNWVWTFRETSRAWARKQPLQKRLVEHSYINESNNTLPGLRQARSQDPGSQSRKATKSNEVQTTERLKHWVTQRNSKDRRKQTEQNTRRGRLTRCWWN